MPRQRLTVTAGSVTVEADIDVHPLTSPVVDLVTGLPGWSSVDLPNVPEVPSPMAAPDVEVKVSQVAALPLATVAYRDERQKPAESAVDRENPCATPNDVVVLLCDVIEEVLGRRAPEVLVHGGAVVTSEAIGLVLLGESKAGKSTLVTTFVDAGTALCTDEVVGFAADGSAFGYARPLHMRPEAPRSARVGQWPTLPGGRFDVIAPPLVHRGSFQPQWCVLIDRRSDVNGVVLDPVTKATVARALIDGSFNAYRRQWDGIAQLAELAPRLRGLRLGYRTATRAVAAMLALVGAEVCSRSSAASAVTVTGPCAISGRRGVAWCYDDSVLIVDGDRVQVIAVAGGPGATPELRSSHEPPVASTTHVEVVGTLVVPDEWLTAVDSAFGGDAW